MDALRRWRQLATTLIELGLVPRVSDAELESVLEEAALDEETFDATALAHLLACLEGELGELPWYVACDHRFRGANVIARFDAALRDEPVRVIEADDGGSVRIVGARATVELDDPETPSDVVAEVNRALAKHEAGKRIYELAADGGFAFLVMTPATAAALKAAKVKGVRR